MIFLDDRTVELQYHGFTPKIRKNDERTAVLKMSMKVDSKMVGLPKAIKTSVAQMEANFYDGEKQLLVEVADRNIRFRPTPDMRPTQAFMSVTLTNLRLKRAEDGKIDLHFTVEVPRDGSSLAWLNANDGMTTFAEFTQAEPTLLGIEIELVPKDAPKKKASAKASKK